jgi:hypothetical protein
MSALLSLSDFLMTVHSLSAKPPKVHFRQTAFVARMASSDAVLEYLREIQDESITRLYEENIWVVMAVLRSLPQLARQVQPAT